MKGQSLAEALKSTICTGGYGAVFGGRLADLFENYG